MSKVKHVHAEVIKAWADGAEIEYRSTRIVMGDWETITCPSFRGEFEYRVKPEPKPDVVLFADITKDTLERHIGHTPLICTASETKWGSDNLKLTFDGETGELKAVELLS